jgi:hypothetical protein
VRTALLCCLPVLVGCGASEREKGAELKANIEAALREREWGTLEEELGNLQQHIKNLQFKDMKEFFSAWPDDSFKAWLKDIKDQLTEARKEKPE